MFGVGYLVAASTRAMWFLVRGLPLTRKQDFPGAAPQRGHLTRRMIGRGVLVLTLSSVAGCRPPPFLGEELLSTDTPSAVAFGV